MRRPDPSVTAGVYTCAYDLAQQACERLDTRAALPLISIMTATNGNAPRTDERELASFRAGAQQWWDPEGSFKPLHALQPVRIRFIRDHLVTHFGRDGRSLKPLEGMGIADIGCGGGLLCEPLARLGAQVTGVDPVADSIETARRHAEGQGLAIRYAVGTAEDLAGEVFDAVISMEVVEHVPDLGAFLKACATILKPGGLLLLSTINRTARSYALAIVGAEYILRWLPRGTHRWEKFVTPEELRRALAEAGLELVETRGCVFNPLGDGWQLSSDIAVNYFAAARKPAEPRPA